MRRFSKHENQGTLKTTVQILLYAAPATGATVDLKKTSYKKLGKLLSVFEKKGLLSQKLVHKQEHLATVNRSHALYTAFAASHGGASSQVLFALHDPSDA
jgi:hypothetical protein